MKTRHLLLIFVCFFFCHAANSQDGWTLKKDNNGIKVFSRKATGLRVNELKVETILEGSLSQLAAVLTDVKNHENWVYKTIKSEVLKETGAANIYYYSEIDAPWPFNNRDLVVQMTIQQNAQTRVMTILVDNVNDYVELKKNLVRISFLHVTWTVTPLNNNQVKVEYQIQINPGDGVPAWLINLFATSGPYETFSNLKEKIKLPQYQQVSFPFLTD
jgi:ribosome-associated toxin RatA of RatAB toxin-antitoxin module